MIQVRRDIKPLHEEAEREATFRFETLPGKQAQVDWGHCWVQIGGKHDKGFLFMMTLDHSWRFLATAAQDERLSTFIYNWFLRKIRESPKILIDSDSKMLL